MAIHIGLIGDYSPEVMAHVAIPKALAIAARDIDIDVEVTWLPTEILVKDFECLSSFNGLWCVPASPYNDMDGALVAIRFAREHGRPFLGTCGGFQHALIEYARNVLKLAEADHAESNPMATLPLIAPLSCSLVEAEGTINLRQGTHISRIYGTDAIVEKYHCSYGVNMRYRSLLESGAMKVAGVDAEGEPRVVELEGHPFFIATLYQPERSALSGVAHPLIREYVQQAASAQVHSRAGSTALK